MVPRIHPNLGLEACPEGFHRSRSSPPGTVALRIGVCTIDVVVVVSDRSGEFVEGSRDMDTFVDCFDAEFVVPAAQVLHERVPSDHHRCCAIALQAAHQSQPRLQPAVIARFVRLVSGPSRTSERTAGTIFVPCETRRVPIVLLWSIGVPANRHRLGSPPPRPPTRMVTASMTATAVATVRVEYPLDLVEDVPRWLVSPGAANRAQYDEEPQNHVLPSPPTPTTGPNTNPDLMQRTGRFTGWTALAT